MNILLVKNIASDAATILENELHDRRRSEPFHHLAERNDDRLAADLRAKLEQQLSSLVSAHPAVADQMKELLARLNHL